MRLVLDTARSILVTGHHLLYGTLILAAFIAACWFMWWDIKRKCAHAQHELLVDELWDEEDDLAEVVA